MTRRPRQGRRGRPQRSHQVRIVVVPREQPDLRLIARALLNLAEIQAKEKKQPATDGGTSERSETTNG